MDSLQLRQIMVAVSDPTARANRAVKRAAALAHKTGARLELFNAVRSPGYTFGISPTEIAEVMRATTDQRRAALEKMATPLRREEISVETSVRTGDVLHEVILRQARLSGADLLVIDAHKHGQLARALFRQTDFELIRRSPIPLLVVKGVAVWRSPRVLAALDPFHSHDKPQALDAEIASSAATLAAIFGGTLHAVHVYWPLAEFFPNVVMEPAIMAVTAAEDKRYEAAVRRQFSETAVHYGVARNCRHLRRGDPAVRLPQLARSLKAGLVVMGAVSRSGVKRLFIGHTAERVLDQFTCDVLIVKSRYT